MAQTMHQFITGNPTIGLEANMRPLLEEKGPKPLEAQCRREPSIVPQPRMQIERKVRAIDGKVMSH